MANVKISELTAATALAATDQFEVNAGGTSKSATAQKIADFLASVSQTLTNKTFDTAGTGNSFKINGTAVSAVTGTGSAVLATAPTLAGATVSAALTYGGVTLSNSVTGTGSMVLSASPTLTGTITAAGASFSSGIGIGFAPTTGYSLIVAKNITGGASANGIYSGGAVQSDVTTAATQFFSRIDTQAAAFTLTTARHFFANQGTFGLGSSVTNQYGFLAESSLTGATNNYGFYGAIASGTGRWNLYMAGDASNYIAGSVGIGSASLTGFTLRTGKNITGATTAYNIQANGTVQSDVTTLYVGVDSSASTQASAFTVANVQHFRANPVSIGSGSVITNQQAFFVPATMTGATNTYGFVGNLAAAANTYNFYAGGTAANYFAGATTLAAALTYGGVTLSNSVTGTGSMVLSASPTFTGTVTTAALTIGSGSALKLGNAYVAGAPTASGYVTIQDSSGTTYKVLVAA